MDTMDGVITIVQESRFQLMDISGVAHLFILGHDTLAEPDQLEPLARSQARVRVHYSQPADVIGFVAHGVTTL